MQISVKPSSSRILCLSFALFATLAMVGFLLVITDTSVFQRLNAWYYGVPQTNYVEQIQIAEFRSDIKVTSFAKHMIILTAQVAVFAMLLGWFFGIWQPKSHGLCQPWSISERLLATALTMITGGTILAYSTGCFLSLPGTAVVCRLYAKESIIDAGHCLGFLASAFMLWTAAWRFGRLRSDPALIIGTVLAGTAAFLFGMEEISWGQTYLQWQSPDFFATYNDQQETNAHNFFNAYLTPIYYMIGAAILFGTLAALVFTDLAGDRWPWMRTLCPPRVLIWVAIWFPIGSEIFIFSSTETFETLLTVYALTYAATILTRSGQYGMDSRAQCLGRSDERAAA